jgi:hypothetical protein
MGAHAHTSYIVSTCPSWLDPIIFCTSSQTSGWDVKPFLASLCEPGSVLSGTHDPQYVVVASAP